MPGEIISRSPILNQEPAPIDILGLNLNIVKKLQRDLPFIRQTVNDQEAEFVHPPHSISGFLTAPVRRAVYLAHTFGVKPEVILEAVMVDIPYLLPGGK